MAEINDDMAKFARLRNAQAMKPLTPPKARDATPQEAAEEAQKPLVEADSLTIGTAPSASEEISAEELSVFVQELKDMPDLREDRIEEVLATLEEDGYDPDTVLPQLISSFIDEEL